MKHTPGKWILELRDKSLPKAAGGHHTIRVDNRLIATVPAYRLGGRTAPLLLEECEANARVMSAAPELLLACKLALDYLEKNKFSDGEAYPALLKAITKAEGTDK